LRRPQKKKKASLSSQKKGGKLRQASPAAPRPKKGDQKSALAEGKKKEEKWRTRAERSAGALAREKDKKPVI